MPDQVQDDTAQMVAFLRARLDEDERVARATTGPWVYHHETDGVVLPGAYIVPDLREIVSTPREPADARHIVRHDSTRVLREVEAKQRIVGLHDGVHECPGASGHMGTYDPSLQVDNYGGPCPTLIAFAAVYADHPDYRESWRP